MSDNSLRTPDDSALASDDVVAEYVPVRNSTVAPRGVTLGATWFLIALAGGLASGLTLNFMRGRFDIVPPTYMNPTAEQSAKYNRERQAGLRQTAAASTGAAGAVLAGFLGLSFGLARRSIWRAIVGMLLGAALGAVLVGFGGMLSQIGYAALTASSQSPPPIWGPLVQLMFWLPLAVALCVAATVAVPARDLVRVVSGLLAGAFVASVVVPITSVILFVLTLRNSRDVLPPETIGHCIVMGLAGSIAISSVVFAVFRRRRSLVLGVPPTS